MFSTPSAAASSSSSSTATPRRPHIASAALRRAGLIDDDVQMKDAPGGAKRNGRHRAHDRPKLERMERDATTARRANLLASRVKTGSTVSIKGVGATSSLAERLGVSNATSPGARMRRNNAARPSETSDRKSGGASVKSVEVLREFVNSRWNPQAQFLNLERMAEDEILKRHKIPPPDSPSTIRTIGPVILKLASQLEPQCLTLSLANNNFTHTTSLSTLHHYLPHLVNLSLENNKIRQLRDLDGLAPRKATSAGLEIKELVLKGNPLREVAVADKTLDSYRSEISRRFPMLEMLDQEPISIPRIGFDISLSAVSSSKPASSIPLPSSFPVEMQPGLFLSGVTELTASFLTQYFTLFDSSRNSLLPVYAPDATFSLSANTSIPPRARKQGLQSTLPNQKYLNWTWILSQSRNLSRVKVPTKAALTLRTGAEAIVNAMSAFPATKHDIAQQSKFVVDAWPIPGVLHGVSGGDVLFISVHGEFSEGPNWGIRSFDRSFVLAVAPEGSLAKQAGWPCVIISDQLVVRGYSSPDAWKAGPLSAGRSGNAATGVSLPPPRPTQPLLNSVLASIPEPQRSLVIQLSAQTGLNSTYSAQCMEGNGWDMQRAVANYEAVKSTLPAEAFTQ